VDAYGPVAASNHTRHPRHQVSAELAAGYEVDAHWPGGRRRLAR